MGPLLRHAAVIQHQDAVGAPDGGQPVGDDKASPSLAQVLHSKADGPLRFRVHVGGSFIQNDNVRVRQKAPGNGQQLPLSLGDAGALVGENGVVTIR